MTYPQLDLKNQAGSRVTLVTNFGELKIQLFDDLAPQTVHNFVELSKKNYYDGQIFHRVIKDFMIQGGDPTGTGTGGESIYGKNFADEFSESLFNLRGALSMANAGPDTNGSQFFIVQAAEIPYSKERLVEGGWPEEIAEAYVKMGGTPHLDGHHTVFGQLMDEASYQVLDKIANTKTDRNDRPKEDVLLEQVKVQEAKKK